MASVDDDNACSSRSVGPFGWLWRHHGTAGALLKTGRLNRPGFPKFRPPLKYLYESPVNGFMLLSSASAALEAPSAKVAATANYREMSSRASRSTNADNTAG